MKALIEGGVDAAAEICTWPAIKVGAKDTVCFKMEALFFRLGASGAPGGRFVLASSVCNADRAVWHAQQQAPQPVPHRQQPGKMPRPPVSATMCPSVHASRYPRSHATRLPSQPEPPKIVLEF